MPKKNLQTFENAFEAVENHSLWLQRKFNFYTITLKSIQNGFHSHEKPQIKPIQ